MIFSTTNYYLIKAKSKKSRICVSTFLYRTLHLKKKKWFKNSHDYSDFLTFPNYMYYDNDVQCLLLSINSIWFRTRLCSPRPAVDYKFRIIWNTCHSQCTDVEYDNCISWHIIVPDNWIPTQVLTSGLYVYRYGKLIIRMLQS